MKHLKILPLFAENQYPEIAPAARAELKTRICELGRHASFEMTCTEILKGGLSATRPPSGARIYIPHPGNRNLLEIADAARAIRACGLTAVPHIAARRLSSKQELTRLLARLQETACNEAFVVGGSAASPRSEFASAIDLLRTGLFQKFGFTRIGVAGHPEGSPDIAAPALAAALNEKNRFAHDEKRIGMYLVTQFCFMPGPIAAWERLARAQGNHLPVHVGVPGLTSIASLLRFAAMCGVRISANFLRGRIGKFARAPSNWSPGPIVLEVAACTLARSECLFAGMHFFPFGGLKRTIAWVNALGEGRFELQTAPWGLEIAGIEN